MPYNFISIGTGPTRMAQAIGIIGGGTMGADIAASFAARGWIAHIANPRDAMRATLPDRLASAMSKLAVKKPNAGHDALSFVMHDDAATLPWADIAIVIEAIPERLALKHALFARLEGMARPDTPLCSNSSALPIGEIGAGLATQHRMVGTHYFMPAHLVPAVEVVCSRFTDLRVADRVSEILRSVGKVPVRVKLDIPGFIANRMQHALSREALKLIERGIATPEDIDNAVRFGFGFRYIAAGPLLQRDHAGLDIHNAAGSTIYPDLCNDAVTSPAMADLVQAGHIGMKAGRGFYEWTDEAIAREKARYEAALTGAMEIIRRETR